MADVKKILLIIGIAVVLAFFIGQGINLVFNQPQWDQYCNESVYGKPLLAGQVDPSQNRTLCESVNTSKWMGTYCDFTYECQKSFNQDNESYNKNVFITSIIIGILLIVASFAIKQEAISIGVLSGALLLIFYGCMTYWGQAAKLIRFIILGVALVVLVFIAYKKFGKNDKLF